MSDLEQKPIVFEYKKLAEILVKQAKIREGHWGIFARFGLSATNIKTNHNDGENIVPAAILPLVELGIQRFPEANSITVDAAKVNPKRPRRKTAAKKKAPAKKKAAAKKKTPAKKKAKVKKSASRKVR